MHTIEHASPASGCTFEVRLSAPVDLPGSLERFRRWGDDLLERWDGEVWLRTHRLDGSAFAYACRPAGGIEDPLLVTTVEHPEQRAAVEAELAAAFPGGSLAELAGRDPIIASLVRLHPGVHRICIPDPLAALVRSISAQQITLRFATTIRQRLALAFGTCHQLAGREVYALNAHRLAEASLDELRAVQLSGTKAASVRAVATAVREGKLEIEDLLRCENEAVIERLTRLPGIGRWSAEWFLAGALGRPLVVAGDLGVRKAVGMAYLEGRVPSEPEVRQATAHWGEAAGLAQQLLLHALAAGTLTLGST